MADVKLMCPGCGQENEFSEFVTPEARRCRKCGAALNVPGATDAPGPSPLKAHLSHRPRLSRSMAMRTERPEGIPENHAILQGKADRAREQAEAAPKIWPGLRYVVLLLVAGLMIAVQWLAKDNEGVRTPYLIARYVLAGMAVIFVLYDAIRDSVMQAFMCIVIPFYVILYETTRVESYWRSGFVLGVLAGLGAELYFIPPDSILMALNQLVSALMEFIRGVISGAQAPMKH